MGFFSLEGTLNGGGALLFGGGSSGAVSSGRIPFRGLLSGQVRRPIGWMVRVIRIIVGNPRMGGTRVLPSGDFCVVFICGRYKFRFTAGISSGYKCPTVREPRLERFVFVLTGPSLSRRAGDSWVGSFPRLCLAEKKTPARNSPGRRSCCFHVVQAVVVCLWFVLLLSFCRICCEKDKNG